MRRLPVLFSLRLRLLAGFGLVIAISLFFAGFASVLLLRDQQADSAEQRVGRLVPGFSERVLSMELFGWPRERIRAELLPWAEYFGVRFLLLDPDRNVVLDTDYLAPMVGQTLSVVERTDPGEGMAQPFFSVRARAHGEDLYLFAASSPLPVVPSARPGREMDDATLVIAVPATDITAAWAQLLPRFAIAGGLAALFAVVVGTLITGRVTRPIVAMTRASEAMAQGDYEQRIDVRGHDEVATLGRAFNQMASQVDRSSTAMRRLLANVSHDLKTPLTSIQGFSQAMIDGVAGDGDDHRQLAEVIHEDADRMRALVDDLLYLSSIESGELALATHDTDLDALIAAGARRLRPQAEAAGISIRHDLHGGTVRADGRRIEQVLANLLDNAVRFAPSGSEVLVSSRTDGDDVLLAVHNGGEPIPEQDLPYVFDRFYQADPARSDGTHSGLGLAIVSELVQAHGGNVTVQSSAEAGTTFTVRLPRDGPDTRLLTASGRTPDGIPET